MLTDLVLGSLLWSVVIASHVIHAQIEPGQVRVEVAVHGVRPISGT